MTFYIKIKLKNTLHRVINVNHPKVPSHGAPFLISKLYKLKIRNSFFLLSGQQKKKMKNFFNFFFKLCTAMALFLIYNRE